MTFRDILSVTFEGPRSSSSTGGSGAGGGAGTVGPEGPAVGGVPGATGGGAVVGTGSGEINQSSTGEPGAAASGEVNGSAAVGGLVVSAQGVGVGVFLAAFILTAVAGNLLVILSVACNRHLQTVTNYFIVNLAVADLLLSAAVLPFSATMEVLGFWAFGRTFCDVWAAVDVLCCTASILSLCTISVDRYVGVRHSLKYPAIMIERKAAAILALLWAVALVVSVGPLLGWKEPVPPDERFCGITEEVGYAIFSSVCSFYLPMAVIVVMYCRVYVVARSTTRSLEAGIKREPGKASEVVLRIHCRGARTSAKGYPGTQSSKGHTLRSSLSVRLLKFSREKKAAKTLAIVVGVFVLCWFPFFFVLPLGSIFPQIKPSEGVFKVIFWLGYFNSCVNPLIYPCSSREFKRAFLRLLRCQCRRRRRRLWSLRPPLASLDRRRAFRLRPQPSHRSPRGPSSPHCTPGCGLGRHAGDAGFGLQQSKASLRLREWRLLGPLQRPTTQLRAKVSSLSHKIRSGARRAETACALRSEVEAVSLNVPQDGAEAVICQAYEPGDYSNLRETD
nr:alpha 1-adrenergic receptor subtype alpha 1D, alpha 1D-AR [rats, hippocampus, Peptide, 559 aa] [Rattus sp.]